MRKPTNFCKVLFYLVMASLMISACSKDDGGGKPSGDYYFRATLDGVKKEFYTVNFQGGGEDGTWEHVVVGGYEARYPTNGGPVPPSLDFEIWRTGGSIVPGTYNSPADPGIISRYAVQTDNGTLLYNNVYNDDKYTIKIEAISMDGIKGTFSGTLRTLEGKAITVTDGSFNLPFEELVNP